MLYYILYSIFYTISLLPFWFLYPFSKLIFIILYYIIQYRKKIIYQNIQNAFPNYSEKEIKEISKKYYKQLSELIIETIKPLSLSKKALKKRYFPKDVNLFNKLAQKHNSILLIQGHYGNWEWFNLMPNYSNFNFYAAYKPINNKDFNKFFIKLRCRFGLIPIPMQKIARTILENKNNKCMHLLIADQSPMRSESKYWTRFLNQDTLVFLGPEKIAKSTNIPVYFLDMDKIGFGKYQFDFIPVCDNPSLTKEFEITELHIRILENKIISKPEYWLWSHRRWKHKKEN